MNNLYLLSKRLKDLRLQFELTQKEVAEQLNITTQSYQAYEIGKTVPKLKHIIVLADIFDVSIDYLVGRKEI